MRLISNGNLVFVKHSPAIQLNTRMTLQGDVVAPTILSVTAPANGTYVASQNLDFTVNFSEAVTKTGTPRLALTIGATTRYANYLSGTGTAALVFRYTVVETDSDTDGIAVSSPIDLNGGTLKDAAGNDATLTFTPPTTTSVLVARTYYIDYANGSDTAPGDGSSANPWKTLSKFLSAGANSNACLVRNGTYYEVALITSKTNLIIQADAGHTPIFTGSVLHAAASWAKTDGYTNVYEITGTAGGMYGVWSGDTRLTSKASIALVDANSMSWYRDAGANKLYINVGGGAPGDINVCDGNANYFLRVNGSGITLSGLTFNWNYVGVDCRAANATIQSCIFKNIAPISANYGIRFASSGGSVSNCTFSLATSGPYGILIDTAASSTTVSGSTFTSVSTGVMVNGGSVSISNLTFTSCGDGVDCNGAAAVTGTISGCTAINNTHGGFRVNGSATVTIDHCLAYLTGSIGTSVTWGFIVDPGGNGTLYHCVAANYKLSVNSGAGFLANGTAAVCLAKNCISYNNPIGYDLLGAASVTGSDYNCANGNTANYSTWTPGANDITTDPTFVDPSTTFDFHLQAGSPCINAGVAIAGINDSDVGGHDIGRYDYP